MTAAAYRTGEPIVGRDRFRVADVLALARGEAAPVLDDDPAYHARLAAARTAVEERCRNGGAVYGVTTGVGSSLENAVPAALRADLPHQLLRFHGCGTGRVLDETAAAAVVAVRLVSLGRGYSGVRPLLLTRLCALLACRLLPRIPEEGSVGASGDLTPLSYLAATLIGEREVTLGGAVMPAAEAHRRVGLEPLVLEAKESLAIMNGTAVMTALGCLALARAERLARTAAALTAATVDAVHGNPEHFDTRLFALKPHPGLVRAGAWIRADLGDPAGRPAPARLQDRYSLRCAPHVIGVLVDALEAARAALEIEVNAVDDNPIVDPERGELLHGGNFYGGHVCFVLDGLKAAVASVADLLDRQLVLLCSPATSDGLPADLVAEAGAGRVVQHGFKAMQISASALAAEALKLTMPAGAFSRSTEAHNQDKVSMGTIAARDCLRVLELTETVAAIGVLATCQALDLRGDGGRPSRGAAVRDAIRREIPMVRHDRRQDLDIARVLALYHAGALPLGAYDDA